MTIRSRRSLRWQDMKKGDIHLKDLIKYFDTYNRSEGKSPATLTWYDQALKVFLNWLIKTNRQRTLDSVDENTVREFILWLQERQVNGHKIKVQSVNNKVRALRAFFNWLYRKGYTDMNVLQDVKPPRIPQIMVDTLSEEEVIRIMTSQDKSTVIGSRNIAIISLFLDSGLRRSELIGLKVQDVHLDDQYVKVMGKGSKERMVAFGNTTRNTLLNYFVHFRGEPAHPGVEEFFLPLDGYPLSKEGVKSVLRRVGNTAGVPRLHAHLCRHTYATNFLINGGNVLLLKQNLGHTTLVMVDRYVHLATSKAAILSRNYSPLDRINIRSLRRGGNRNRDNYRNDVKAFRRYSK
jgi:integrase/recombinase XerC